MVTELARGALTVAAAAVSMLSQPSRQPAPAIQKATANASDTRTILIEESDFIAASV